MVHISGPSAEMRAGYQRAVVLGAWTITPSSAHRNTFVFSATMTWEHPVWSRMPLDLVVRLGTTEWIWRQVAVQRDGAGVEVLLTERPSVSQHQPEKRGIA